MKSARINFGIPESEYILEVDDSGAATSLVNQDTGTEYVGGGGGGSDFSTAKLTIINNSGASVDCTLIVAKYLEWNDTYTSYSVGFLENDNTPVEYDLILYKGNSQVYIDTDPEKLTLSGSIISDDDGGYYAQGDCSITISA